MDGSVFGPLRWSGSHFLAAKRGLDAIKQGLGVANQYILTNKSENTKTKMGWAELRNCVWTASDVGQDMGLAESWQPRRGSFKQAHCLGACHWHAPALDLALIMGMGNQYASNREATSNIQ